MKPTEIHVIQTLNKFGSRELHMAIELLEAYSAAGTWGHNFLPETFDDHEVYLDANPASGLVYLTNTSYQPLVMSENGLVALYCTPYAGHEGTMAELSELFLRHSIDGGEYKPSDDSWVVEDMKFLESVIEEDFTAVMKFTPESFNHINEAKKAIQHFAKNNPQP